MIIAEREKRLRESRLTIEYIKRLHNETWIYNDKQYDWRMS